MMNQSQKQYDELRLLISQSEEGDIGLEGMQRLNNILLNDPQARKYYREYIHTNVILKSLYANEQFSFKKPEEYEPQQGYIDLFCELAQYEKTAPEIEIPTEKSQRELIHEIVYSPREKQKVTKFQIVTFMLSAAAILFFVLFFEYVPPKGGIEVATLSDSINAKWLDIDVPMQNGTRLTIANNKRKLRDGVIELTFDNYVKAIIEAPAEFQILANDRIYLNYGKVYVVVPKEAIGFSVYTSNAKVIDLGTEFGAQVNAYGDTQLYVFKGKTSLVAGRESNRISMEVTKDTAKRISGITQEISDCSFKDQLFVRRISSADKLVWRGESVVDLADIVGGGNGFGTGRKGGGIDPTTGKLVAELSMSAKVQEECRYSEVVENRYIDGVFVPLGDETPQIVTSRGDVFEECPKTDGRYWVEITNKPIIGFPQDPDSMRLAQLNGVEYGSNTHPGIMMHANTGITFDLEAIRSIIPNSRIRRFTSFCGLSETLNGLPLMDDASADMWVLVDGQRREKIHVDFSNKSNDFITVLINDNDRFLTLISCSDWNAGDWTLFGDPVLDLELKD